ncbi:UrcA family protein [Sandarakinorhabdus rubra]|uniref:UrcA family protein n=1 Tax=Sandarakinorhabdus rubra TaxID=2672568 RepID=UPI0013DC5D8A|nr:UrcA family protein [Sandarakinorhabdus rubra]
MRLMLTFAVAAAVAVPALAEPMITVPSGRSLAVATGDLDLASAGGQRELDRRLWRAARQVCSFTALRDLSESRLVDRCRADALARVAARRQETLAN